MTIAPARPGRRSGATTTDAIVLRRVDFRESSRIVTALTRDHGCIAGLAKGAHRPSSPFLGRIDFLNEIRATFSADRGGLRLLTRAELVRERRGLRAPQRCLAAGHLAALCEAAASDAAAAPAAFDLMRGGLSLLEQCPARSLPLVVLGLELHLLDQLGALPELHRCAACTAPLGGNAFRSAATPGLLCRRHAGSPRRPVPKPALELLRQLRTAAGRQWPDLPAAAVAAASPLPADWLFAATELHLPWRRLLFDPAS